MGAPVPLFGPIPGGIELVVILGIAVLLFGANKIPQLARSSGQAMGEFKRGRADLESEIRDAADETTAATSAAEKPSTVTTAAEKSTAESEGPA